jgi:deoxyribodipyrimidine photolyase
MTEHSEASTEGEDTAVLRYLAAIETRRTAPDTLPEPDAAAGTLAAFEPPEEERPELEEELAAWTPGSAGNLARLEDDFVAAAADYGRRHGVDYEGWRKAGVPEDVLRRAGIAPGDEPS